MGKPLHQLPDIFWKSILDLLYMAFPWGPLLPPVPERLLFSPADAYSGTLGIYPRIDSMGSYCCNHGDEHIVHPLTSQCHLLTPQQPLTPSSRPSLPLRGIPHEGLPPFWIWTWIWTGTLQLLLVHLPQMWWGNPACVTEFSKRTGCPWWLLLSAGACKAVGQATSWTGRHCDKGPWSPYGRFSTLLASWQGGPPPDQALVDSAGGLSRGVSPPLSALVQWHVGTSHEEWWASGNPQFPI